MSEKRVPLPGRQSFARIHFVFAGEKFMKMLGTVLLALTVLVGAAVSAKPPQAGQTWGIWFGDPVRTGSQTTTITVTYTNSLGVKKTKTVRATVNLDPGDSADSKKEKVQRAINDALAANRVGGEPLASTGGTGNAMTITPAPNNPGGFSDARIKEVETEDDETGEDDRIIKPAKKAVASVSPPGEVIGQTRDLGPSVFFVTTNLGTVSVQLSGNMSKLDLLKDLQQGLVAQDHALESWIDTDLMVLFIMLEASEGIVEIGAGSTDMGLTARCKVQLLE